VPSTWNHCATCTKGASLVQGCGEASMMHSRFAWLPPFEYARHSAASKSRDPEPRSVGSSCTVHTGQTSYLESGLRYENHQFHNFVRQIQDARRGATKLRVMFIST
jgi:hypothetical protein